MITPKYSADVHRARKEYKCGAEGGCSKKILPGDLYSCITEQRGDRFRTYRYCLDCAQELHPRLVKQSMLQIKSGSKRRVAEQRLKRARFSDRQSGVLRRRSSPPEKYLWSFLCNKQMGFTFFRQKILQGFVIDFWCPELELALELDGQHHISRREKDHRRDTVLREHGITVLRFPARAVYTDIAAILDTIRMFSTKQNR